MANAKPFECEDCGTPMGADDKVCPNEDCGCPVYDDIGALAEEMQMFDLQEFTLEGGCVRCGCKPCECFANGRN